MFLVIALVGLGIGEKLLAVPYSELKFNHGMDEMFFVLSTPLEKI